MSTFLMRRMKTRQMRRVKVKLGTKDLRLKLKT